MDHIERERLKQVRPDIARSHLFESDDMLRNNGDKILKIYYDRVSVKLLEKILEDDDYFEYAKRVFQSRSIFNICSLSQNNIHFSKAIERYVILKGLEMIAKEKDKELSEKERSRYEELKSYALSLEQLRNTCGDNYIVTVDNHTIQIPYDDLFEFLKNSSKKIKQICSDDNIKTIKNIPKELFMFAIYNLLREKIEGKSFLVTTEIRNIYEMLMSNQYTDFESIGKYDNVDNSFLDKANVSDELRHAVFDKMDNNLSLVEKAIYVYMKLCKLLTFDDEYYSSIHGPATERHLNLSNIKTITPQNNRIICFDFNIIYAKLLQELGINSFSFFPPRNSVESYLNVHVSLDIRIGKALIKADSTESLLKGDLVAAKIGNPISGIVCYNSNKKTKDEFYAAFKHVKEIIKNEDKDNSNSLDELLANYSRLTSNLKPTDSNKRIEVLMETINNTNLVGVDSLASLKKLINLLFTDIQRGNIINYTIISNFDTGSVDKWSMANAVISYNPKGLKKCPEENVYYLFNPGVPPIKITRDELQRLFNSHSMSYIHDKYNIPGINKSEIEAHSKFHW